MIDICDMAKGLNLDEYSCLTSANQLRDLLELDVSARCICSSIGHLSNGNSPRPKPTKFSEDPTFEDNHFGQLANDSFTKDFRQLELSVSYESDTCQESRYSDCSSVSLSKFLSVDKKDGDQQAAEYAAFNYMKEILETKHRNEFKRLLEEQQKEHENLRAHFGRISSLSKSTPSPKYEVKKYSPVQRSCTPVGRELLNGELSRTETSTPKKVGKVDKVKQKIYNLPKKTRQKIHALIVGHLTRQLFRTEQVTRLVQTIKDCLVTAMSLQNESNLGLSELDLQSRLLQQVC